MDLKKETVTDEMKFDIIRYFLSYHCGMRTQEQLFSDLLIFDQSVDRKRNRPVSDLDFQAYEDFFVENTDEDTIRGMVSYHCERDEQKAKELILGAAQRGDFYAQRFAKKKEWL